MLLKSNIRLLLDQLGRLSETPYFSNELDIYICELRDALSEISSRLQSGKETINIDLAQSFVYGIWQLTQFLTGSTAKQIPYEVVYAIERAAKDWGIDNLLITTAVLQEPNFYFHTGSQSIFSFIEKELGIKFSYKPVQIALPYIYRHKPLFCVPLFHELGHFFDTTNEIVKTSLLHAPAYAGPDLPDLPSSMEIAKYSYPEKEKYLHIVENHRKEYFADLISVAYVGKAAYGFLQEFAQNQNASFTHPSSEARFSLLSDFINDIDNDIINLFQKTLNIRGLPSLNKRFRAVCVDNTFGYVRPCQLSSDQEVFGIFESSWIFLKKMIDSPDGLWSALKGDETEIEKITNDLVEKSIRNRMILEDWCAATNT